MITTACLHQSLFTISYRVLLSSNSDRVNQRERYQRNLPRRIDSIALTNRINLIVRRMFVAYTFNFRSCPKCSDLLVND